MKFQFSLVPVAIELSCDGVNDEYRVMKMDSHPVLRFVFNALHSLTQFQLLAFH